MNKCKEFIANLWGKTRTTRIVMRKELASYFISPIAYIVITLFLAVAGFIFFSTFFFNGVAEMRSFFELLPILFSIFIPALTMKLFAEERNSGSIEMLLTMPFTTAEVVAGKIAASTIFIAAMLTPTIIYPISIRFVGPLDLGPVLGGYIGALLLGMAFSAVGVFASSMTKNQIIAFIVAFAICMFLTLVDKFLVLIPSRIVGFVEYLGADFHFKSVARGVIDSRDIIYFVSVVALSSLGAIKSIEDRR